MWFYYIGIGILGTVLVYTLRSLYGWKRAYNNVSKDYYRELESHKQDVIKSGKEAEERFKNHQKDLEQHRDKLKYSSEKQNEYSAIINNMIKFMTGNFYTGDSSNLDKFNKMEINSENINKLLEEFETPENLLKKLHKKKTNKLDMNTILEKISNHGIDSLDDEEKKFLKKNK